MAPARWHAEALTRRKPHPVQRLTAIRHFKLQLTGEQAQRFVLLPWY